MAFTSMLGVVQGCFGTSAPRVRAFEVEGYMEQSLEGSLIIAKIPQDLMRIPF